MPAIVDFPLVIRTSRPSIDKTSTVSSFILTLVS